MKKQKLPEAEQLRKKIIALRRKDNLSQLAFAEKTGLSFETIGAIERGKSVPTLPTLLKICKAFNIPLHVFVNLKIRQSRSGVRYIMEEQLKNIMDGVSDRELGALLKIAEEIAGLNKPVSKKDKSNKRG